MSPRRTRTLSIAAFSILGGLALAILNPGGFGDSSLMERLLSGVAIVLVVMLAHDLVLRATTTKRLRWIHRLGDDLREIARGEKSGLTPGNLPGHDLVPVRDRFIEVAEAIIRQRSGLEQQKKTLGEILNGMGEGLLAIDENKRIVLANDRICEIFGLRRPEPGRLYYEVLRHSSLVAAFDHGLDGESFRERATVSTGNNERQVEIRVVPAARGTGIAAVALVIDITQIEMLARMRQDFIADFSHEVRTPLAGLRSSIETLQSGNLQHDQEDQLRRILDRQVGRLERLVSDLAELNSIESGDTVLQKEPTELRLLLSDLAQDFFERADDRKIAIIVDGDESVANVDPIRIEQVFSNLIDNALKHAPDSDEVRIDVRDGDTVSEVRVSDRGPGIPPAEREKVFNRFYRIDKSRSGEIGGTGLGLAITKHLVIQHGGTIAVEGEVGRGTTFVVRLPKAEC